LEDGEEMLKEKELKLAIQNNQMKLLEDISDICFVAMGQTNDLIFFDIIKPAIERYGLRSLRRNDLLVTQGSIMDNIRTTILQCRLVIAEITDRNPNVMYELGLSIESKKFIILLSQTDIPSDLMTFHNIIYKNTSEEWNILYSKLRSEIEKLLFENALIQARQLMKTGFFGPAVMTITSYLDRSIENLLTRIQDLPSGKRNFRSMIDTLVKLNIIDNNQRQMLSEWRVIRNKAIHELIYPTREQATEIIDKVDNFVNYLRSIEKPAYLWWSVLNDTDRKTLTEKFLGFFLAHSGLCVSLQIFSR
jgi:Domain of unknown function (DUF4145)